MQNLSSLVVHGMRVLTTRQLAGMYGTEPEIINNNFIRNKTKYVLEKHYVSVSGEEMRQLKTSHQFDGELKRVSRAYFWTEKGALLHAKSLNTDKAWEVYDYLVDYYFRVNDKSKNKEIIPVMPSKKLDSNSISSSKSRVVDIPENKEAQELITQVKKYLTGMEIVLEMYNTYQKEENFERIKYMLFRMEGKIVNVVYLLYKLKPTLVKNVYKN